MSEPIDTAALRELYAAVDPSLLPLQICAGIIPRTYFVQAANGEDFASVHGGRLAVAALVVQTINQQSALLDELDAARYRITELKAVGESLHRLQRAAEDENTQLRARIAELEGEVPSFPLADLAQTVGERVTE